MAHPSAFGNLWSNGKQTTRPVKVIDPQGHQFLPPQSSIVGKQDHGTGPGIFMENNMLNKLLPDFIRGHPGESLVSTYRPARWMLSISAIIASLNRVDRINAQTFSQKKIVEEAASNNTLGNGII